MGPRRIVASFAALAGLFVSTPARAQPTDTDRILAQSLFDQARQLMDAGDYPKACPKLAESQRLDPGGGTLLNLAVCHEGEGRTATAWTELNEALSMAKRDGRADRVQTARERLSALEGKLSTLSVTVPAEAIVPGLEVRIDGATLRRAGWNTPVPIDPGAHEISATAQDRRPWRQTVRVAPDGDRQEVRVPALDTNSSSRPKGAATFGGGASSRRTAAYVVGGVSLVALGAAAIFGVRAVVKKNESDSHCERGCDQTGADAWSAAKTSAVVFDVGAAVGVVGLGIATYLLLSSPAATSRQTTAR